MRAFLVACLAIVVVAVGGYFFVNAMQESSGLAYATDGARINTSWAWRSVSGPTGASEPGTQPAQAHECDARKTWQWIFVDFGRPDGESAACSISQ
jgi:hypothetical protein